MAEIKEPLSEPEQISMQEPAPVRVSNPAHPKESGNILMPLLTTLLAVVGIGELALGGYIGLSAYGGIQAQRAYEARLAETQTESGTTQGSATFSFSSPWRTIINGETVWEIEDETNNSSPPEISGQDQGEEAAPDERKDENQVQASSPQTSNGADSPGNAANSGESNLAGNTTTPSTGTPSSGTVTLPVTSTVDTPNSGTSNPPATSTEPSGGNSTGTGFDTGRFDRPNWPEGKFLAATTSNKYHSKNCSTGAARIRPENEIWFNSEEEAQAAGYERCGNCWR